MLVRNGVFCVNTLAAGDLALAEAFAGRAGLHGAARFDLGRWGRLATASPVLESSIAAFDCRLTDSRLVATHYVMIGEVGEVKLGPAGPGLVYRERGYHEL
jgi:flavin reductase (DIM6/NTAB) family NADH-FMN oxidoreductase RutF